MMLNTKHKNLDAAASGTEVKGADRLAANPMFEESEEQEGTPSAQRSPGDATRAFSQNPTYERSPAVSLAKKLVRSSSDSAAAILDEDYIDGLGGSPGTPGTVRLRNANSVFNVQVARMGQQADKSDPFRPGAISHAGSEDSRLGGLESLGSEDSSLGGLELAGGAKAQGVPPEASTPASSSEYDSCSEADLALKQPAAEAGRERGLSTEELDEKLQFIANLEQQLGLSGPSLN
eukprot:gene32963-42063_t